MKTCGDCAELKKGLYTWCVRGPRGMSLLTGMHVNISGRRVMNKKEHSIEELKQIWEKRNARIRKERRLSWYGLFIQMIMSVIVIVLLSLKMIDVIMFISAIVFAMMLSLVFNLVAHVRIQNIIWEGL
jgi:hypothetical protein